MASGKSAGLLPSPSPSPIQDVSGEQVAPSPGSPWPFISLPLYVPAASKASSTSKGGRESAKARALYAAPQFWRNVSPKCQQHAIIVVFVSVVLVPTISQSKQVPKTV